MSDDALIVHLKEEAAQMRLIGATSAAEIIDAEIRAAESLPASTLSKFATKYGGTQQ